MISSIGSKFLFSRHPSPCVQAAGRVLRSTKRSSDAPNFAHFRTSIQLSTISCSRVLYSTVSTKKRTYRVF